MLEWQTLGPIDRTPGIPGSDKKAIEKQSKKGDKHTSIHTYLWSVLSLRLIFCQSTTIDYENYSFHLGFQSFRSQFKRLTEGRRRQSQVLDFKPASLLLLTWGLHRDEDETQAVTRSCTRARWTWRPGAGPGGAPSGGGRRPPTGGASNWRSTTEEDHSSQIYMDVWKIGPNLKLWEAICTE